MSNQADLRRRWAGALFLGVSLLMLIAGESLLKAQLTQNAWLTIGYWMICFVFVILAVINALRDLAEIRRQTRQEARGLMSETLKEIAQDKAARDLKPGRRIERKSNSD